MPKAIEYDHPPSTNENTIPNWIKAPMELNPTNFPYCSKVFDGEKSLSPKVHALFNTKFEVIDAIIPIIFAWRYQNPVLESANNNDIR